MSFPEHAQAAARAGCHGYIVSAMFDDGLGMQRRSLLGPARALDNASYVVVPNHCAKSGVLRGCDHSAIWNPDGTLLADAGRADPGVALGVLEPEALQAARAKGVSLAEVAFESDLCELELVI